MLQPGQGFFLQSCKLDIPCVEGFDDLHCPATGLYQRIVQVLQRVPDLCRMPLGLQHFRLQAVRLVAGGVVQVLPAGLGVGVDDHEKQDDGPEPAEHHVQEGEAECVKRPAFHVRKPG